MKHPEFIKFFTGIPKCSKELHTANTVQLKPYSNETYMLSLPKGFIEVDNVKIIDKHGNSHTLDYSPIETQNDNSYFFITNIMYDDWEPVYLKFVSEDFGTLYSSPFRVSSLELNNTSYIKFKDHDWRHFGGMRLNMMYWHQMAKNEITTYYQVTREQTISVGSKRDRLERFWIDNVSIFCANALMDVLTLPIIYIDTVRSSPYEIPEIDTLKARENFVSFEINVTQNINDIDNTPIDTNLYVIGNRQLSEIVGDGNDNIINSNINNNGN